MAPAPGRPRAALGLGLLWAAALAGCAPTQLAGSPTYAPAPRAAPQTPRSTGGEGVSDLANLPGWADEDHSAALAAFQAGCAAAAAPGMQAVCTRARALGRVDDPAARIFFETNFKPVILPGPGLLTAYFAPEYPARSTPEAGFSAALRGKPADLVYPPGDMPPTRPATSRWRASSATAARPGRTPTAPASNSPPPPTPWPTCGPRTCSSSKSRARACSPFPTDGG